MPLLNEQEIENTAFTAGCHANKMVDPRPELTGWIVSDDVLEAFALAVELKVLDKLRALTQTPVAFADKAMLAEFGEPTNNLYMLAVSHERDEPEDVALYTADQAAAIALHARQEGKQDRDTELLAQQEAPASCETCKGVGEVATGIGMLACSDCNGTGIDYSASVAATVLRTTLKERERAVLTLERNADKPLEEIIAAIRQGNGN